MDLSKLHKFWKITFLFHAASRLYSQEMDYFQMTERGVFLNCYVSKVAYYMIVKKMFFPIYNLLVWRKEDFKTASDTWHTTQSLWEIAFDNGEVGLEHIISN